MDRIVAVPEALHYAEARTRVLDAVRPSPDESLPLEEARGRAARQALIAGVDLPPFRNASMDGAAVRAADLAQASASRGIGLAVAASIAAGAAPSGLAAGTCAWIMTGAPLPEGADAVVPIEELAALDGATPEKPGGIIRFSASVAPGANVRDAGADTRAGETLWQAGRELSAHDLGLLAALGSREVVVGSRPRVAVVSTGDELLARGEPPRRGAIYDSNRPMLGALLEECGARVVSSQHVGDDVRRVTETIEGALASADVTITIGGVSAGAFDPVKLGITGIEGIALWRVAMKPGRPQAFGSPGGRLFFGLPGNPGSVACVFEMIVRPALRKLQGFAELERPRLFVRAGRDFESRGGRTDFVWVCLTGQNGDWWAFDAGRQVSGHVTPPSRAHALLMIPPQTERVAAGDEALAWLLRWPGAG